MAKRRKTAKAVPQPSKAHAKEPKLTHLAYRISLAIILAGLLAQLIMAVIAYPTLPARIPQSWLGTTAPGKTAAAWIVFFYFPGAQIIMILVALFSPRDGQGRRVMTASMAATLVLLTCLFLALQASVFRLPKL
jgi:uncharacterized membrane protein